jgi:hypothetical protein
VFFCSYLYVATSTQFGDAPGGPLDHAPTMQQEGLSQLIVLRCVRPEHLGARGDDRVFVHRGGWAYCPAGRNAPEHRLIQTGGIALRYLESGKSDTRR